MREGNLEAPTRHPLDWTSIDFYREDSLNSELERVFDICQGCRRCVSLCGAFPTLFELVDATRDGEMAQVPKQDFPRVVDQCYLCDLCYVTKCPYVPPHPWNVDFPHLMLRAKAVKFKKGPVRYRDRLLSRTDTMGKLAGIPIVTEAVNALNRKPWARAALESTLGVDRRAWLPEFARKKFRDTAEVSSATQITDGERTPGKVLVYATCYVNYNEPGIGDDLLALLEHNAIPYVLASKEECCGMPLLEQGDLEGVARKHAANIAALLPYARAGYAILAAIPSCTLMYKQELPLMFPDDTATGLVRDAMWDPFEYFMARYRDGLLRTDFSRSLGRVSYHLPCHSRVQKMGRKTAEVLQLVPETTLSIVERCSGHAGTFGVKAEFHDTAMKIGKPVFKAMAEGDANYYCSDCQLAAHHIAQGTAEAGLPQVELAHPLTLLRLAYGL